MESPVEFDAVVVGSGPNGLAAAIVLQQVGLSVLLIEGSDTIGGGLRTKALTLPGFQHDVCSAIHPLAMGSPFFQKLPLAQFGLKFIQPDIAAAHPLDDGTAASLHRSIDELCDDLGSDGRSYRKLISPLVDDWPLLINSILGPLRVPSHPIALGRFGLKALQSAESIVSRFHTAKARALWGGMAAHSILPLSHLTTSAIGMVLLGAGHVQGWPIPQGGSQAIADALCKYFLSLGGQIKTGWFVRSLGELPKSRAVLFDITPKQLIAIAGQSFSSLYRWQLQRYRYGMGVFKMDWALSEPIPFRSEACRMAGTVHLGNTFEEIASGEHAMWNGKHSEKPFVLLAQQSLFDTSRAPAGKHTAWAYCHVPHGSTSDMTEVIESQVERFAPGFRDCIIGRHTMNTAAMEEYNPNYIGGDINGGRIDLTQLFTRPALRASPYKTSAQGIYICSSSTPPGGGVHGMCGYHAAKRALRDVFKLEPKVVL